MNLSSAEMKEKERLAYSVGALLYCPAINGNVASSLKEGHLEGKFSLALCLEDSISENAVADAEMQIAKTIGEIYSHKMNTPDFAVPQIFIRVRKPTQAVSIFETVYGFREILAGFIFPKYSPHRAESYNADIVRINDMSDKRIYMMPILESPDIVNLETRRQALLEIKRKIDPLKDYVLNIRIGGNDFCNYFGIRRHCNETIYEILPVSNVLSDIITVFSGDYILSGPVWEYFSGEGSKWEDGLRKELKCDMLNGFIGKTVIHPNQIPVVNECMKISKKDFEDANAIVNWNNEQLLVGKSLSGERMNEIRTHLKWAEKIMALAEIYGVY